MHQCNWEPLRKWFADHQRDLPWRQNRSPYAVWVSEVMLQQTRAEVVVPFFTRWMELFPSLVELARAPWEKVLKAWEGLGYYSRAQRLHQGAQLVLAKWGGTLPHETHELDQIPGLGPYTIAAIQAFAFQMRSAPVDGNVLRVRSRLLADAEPIQAPRTQKQAREWLLQALPEHAPWQVAEALIELGARICKPQNPECASCPLITQCKGYRQGELEKLPQKVPRPVVQKVTRHVLLAYTPHQVLLEQVASGRAFSLLTRFPTFETEAQLRLFERALLSNSGAIAPVQNCLTRVRRFPASSDSPGSSVLAPRLLAQTASSLVEGERDAHRSPKTPEASTQQSVLVQEWCCAHTYVHTHCTLMPWRLKLSSGRTWALLKAPEEFEPLGITQPSHSEEDAPDHGPGMIQQAGQEISQRVWYRWDQLPMLSFPSGHRTLLQHLETYARSSFDSDRSCETLSSPAS